MTFMQQPCWTSISILQVNISKFLNLGFDEFQNLLTKQAPIEGYTEWLDNIIDKCVLQVIIVNKIFYYWGYVPLLSNILI